MSLTKRFTGNYTLESIDSTKTLVMDNTGKVTISGDLAVLGTTTTIESINTEIVDNIVVLNSGELGTGVTLGTSGLQIDRGLAAPAGIEFDEADDTWKINDGGGVWVAITTGGVGMSSLADDNDPHLGGDLIVAGFSITSAPTSNLDVTLDADGTGLVKINHKLSLENQSTPASYNEIYADDVGLGGTGLYTGAAEELVSKTKAITYGLIL